MFYSCCVKPLNNPKTDELSTMIKEDSSSLRDVKNAVDEETAGKAYAALHVNTEHHSRNTKSRSDVVNKSKDFQE